MFPDSVVSPVLSHCPPPTWSLLFRSPINQQCLSIPFLSEIHTCPFSPTCCLVSLSLWTITWLSFTNVHLEVSTYRVCLCGPGLPHSRCHFLVLSIYLQNVWCPSGCLGSIAEAAHSFWDGKHCRETPARSCAGLKSFKNAQPHKQESSREELLKGRILGKLNRSPWTFCRHSGGFASKALHDDNVASRLHILSESTKMQ